jgi:peptidyl-prolyl cis-trans isomerase B (cyclophilin B)
MGQHDSLSFALNLFCKINSLTETRAFVFEFYGKNSYIAASIVLFYIEGFMITLQTNLGSITLELDFENTPKTAENFLAYVKSGFYEGTIFHRVIDGFMIQGGAFDENMQQKKGEKSIQNEANKGQANKRGTLAMARTSDPHSASNQFFINVKDNDFLNFSSESSSGWGYCVFGKVVEGMDVIDKMKKVATGSRAGHQDVPNEAIIIEKVTINEAASAENSTAE